MRWLVPLAAAVVVIGVLVGIGLFAGRPGGGAPQAGSGGSGGGQTHPASPLPITTGPSLPPGGHLRTAPVTGYRTRDGGRALMVAYTARAPSCYGRVRPARVVETTESVTVTLLLRWPRHRLGIMCPDYETVKTMTVHLSRPLGDRVVLDGSRHGRPVPRGVPSVAGPVN